MQCIYLMHLTVFSDAFLCKIAICSTLDLNVHLGLISPGDVMYSPWDDFNDGMHYIIEPRTNSDTLRIGGSYILQGIGIFLLIAMMLWRRSISTE